MPDVTINGLGGPLATPAADDLIPIWDTSAAQMLKVRRDVLLGATITGGGTIATGGYTLTVPATGTAALAGVSNVATTFGNVQIGGTGLGLTRYNSQFVRVRTMEVQLADDAVWLTPDKILAFVMVAESAFANYAIAVLQGGLNAAVNIAKSAGVTVGSDPDGTLNLYYDSGNAKYAIRNRLGTLTGIRVHFFDMGA